MDMVTDKATADNITAAMIQWPNGRDRDAEYSVFFRPNGGGEVRQVVDYITWGDLVDAAGEPTYREGAYVAWEREQ